jgi:hypothetical protein
MLSICKNHIHFLRILHLFFVVKSVSFVKLIFVVTFSTWQEDTKSHNPSHVLYKDKEQKLGDSETFDFEEARIFYNRANTLDVLFSVEYLLLSEWRGE